MRRPIARTVVLGVLTMSLVISQHSARAEEGPGYSFGVGGGTAEDQGRSLDTASAAATTDSSAALAEPPFPRGLEISPMELARLKRGRILAPAPNAGRNRDLQVEVALPTVEGTAMDMAVEDATGTTAAASPIAESAPATTEVEDGAAADEAQDIETAPQDAAASRAPGPEPDAATLNQNFTGFTYTGWIPPDPHMATGPSDLIVAVNSSWRIYNKNGGSLFTQTLLNWFSNVLPANNSGIRVFDPWVLYDQISGRYVLVAAARRDSDSLSRFLVSVSDNTTATGGWCNYSLNARLNGNLNTNNWADYPKAGITNNNVILSANMFAFGGSFQYAKLRFLPKATLYNTSCPGIGWWDFWDLRNADNTKAFTIQPAHSYILSNTSYLINSRSGSGSNLTLWRVTTPATFPPGPTLVRQATLGTASYSAPPNAQQRGSSTPINTGDARLLTAIYRGSGLWTTHTIACSWPGESTRRSCIRWYQIRPTTNTLLQQSTYGATGYYYYYPALTADSVGNAWFVFNRSNSSIYAGIRHTARNSSNAANTLQGSALLRAGQGCYVLLDSVNRNRWGDYNGAAIDPSGGGAWIFSEYAFGTSATCGNNRWRTHVARLGMP